MKNTNQIAETVLTIRNAEQEKAMIRNRRIRRVTAGASTMLVFCAVILTIRHFNLSQIQISSLNDDYAVKTETSTTISDTDNSPNESIVSEHLTKSTVKENALAEKTETSSHSTENDTFPSKGNNHATTSGTRITGNTTEPSEKPTEGNGSEAVIIPKWDERTLSTQFMEFDLNGISYNTKDHIIEGSYIVGFLGTVTMEGQDVYENRMYSINAEVFGINSISSNCAVAVKFNGYDRYYVYTNRSYSPATLGELVDAIKLNDTISFGTLTPDDRTFVTDYDKSIMSGLLDEYRDCATLFDYTGHRKLFSVSASVDMLGISNKSLAVTEDGYITTNIMDRGYAFYIGEDKAREIADRLGIDNIERDTTPYTFDPQEEVVYEE